MQNHPAAPFSSSQLEREIQSALMQGQEARARSIAITLLERAPENALALEVAAQCAMRAREYSQARDCFERLAKAHPNPMHWVNAAQACAQLEDTQGEAQAIQQALVLEPTHLIALICKARMLERQGERHKAAVAHGAVAAVSPPLDQLSPDLRSAVIYGMQYRDAYNREFGKFLDERLTGQVDALPVRERDRFQLAVDIMTGRKRRYDSQSMVFHYPGLVPVEFFDRSRFAWLDQFESRTDDIRDEFLQVLKSEEGFVPYLTYPPGSPVNQFAELNNSPDWSAYHLKQAGMIVEDHARKCPVTMELLSRAPQPDQPGRTPAAMFSILKPRTRIPAHVGVSNTRLITHVPLIIPERCGFRVGNTTREWVPGQAWVFDDTIEHEAWNMSDKMRVILMFDIWHPDLDLGERQLITELMASVNRFTGDFSMYEL